MEFKSIELGRSFKTRESLHDALLLNQTKIIQYKTEQEFQSYKKGQISSIQEKVNDAIKSAFAMKEGFIYPVINTTNFMDSHFDVHFPGIWDDCLETVANSLAYVTDHELKIDNVIAFPGFVRAFVVTVDWVSLGYNYPGKTQALVYEIAVDQLMHDKAKQIVKNRIKIQNSVRMCYLEMFLAINDEREEFKGNKELFDSRINKIVNKELALESGYFWGVDKANIVLEGSMVLRGSNEITPLLLPDENQIIIPQMETKEIVKTEGLHDFYKLFIN